MEAGATVVERSTHCSPYSHPTSTSDPNSCPPRLCQCSRTVCIPEGTAQCPEHCERPEPVPGRTLAKDASAKQEEERASGLHPAQRHEEKDSAAVLARPLQGAWIVKRCRLGDYAVPTPKR